MSERLTQRTELGTAVFNNVDIGNIAKKLCEIEDKICEGKIVELPCKVGQRIYRIMPKHDTLGYRTGEYKVADIWQVTEIVVYEEETVFVDDSGNEFMADDIGKTVFLARAEAEKALERSENGSI